MLSALIIGFLFFFYFVIYMRPSLYMYDNTLSFLSFAYLIVCYKLNIQNRLYIYTYYDIADVKFNINEIR